MKSPAHDASRDDSLDVLRACAILSVLSFHALDLHTPPSSLARVLAFGWMGVDLFFVLSGFLIARQVFRAQTRRRLGDELRTFWLKRWFRTLPLYYAVLFVFVVVKPHLLHFRFRGEVWPYLFFVQNFRAPEDFVPSWSLCVEEQFYLVFPLVAFDLARRVRLPSIAWLAPMGLSVLFRLLIWPPLHATSFETFSTTIAWPTYTHMDGLAVGVFLAATEPTWGQWQPRRRGAMAGLGLLLFLGTCAAFGARPSESMWGAILVYPLTATAFGMVLAGLRGVTFPRSLMALARPVALWSYGAYLWHALISRVTDHLGPHLGPWSAQVAVFVGMTFALSWATYRCIERPMLTVRDRLLGASTASHANLELKG
jgi:peptidoglycan/LPS O-acetylase OafA/YrhL